MTALYDRITDPDLLIRRINIAACALIREEDIPPEQPEQLDFFTDYEERDRQRQQEEQLDRKEKNILIAMLRMQERYGKNAVLRGMNLVEGGTTIERNGQVGGHKAE